MKNLFKIIIAVPLIIIFALAGILSASDEALVIPYKNTIRHGVTASAEQMVKRFEAIEAVINQNLIVMYDYGAPANTARVFNLTNSPTTLLAITYEVGKETWEYSDGHKVEYLTADSDEGTMEVGRREYNTSGVMTQNLTYDPMILGIDLLVPKQDGKTWGGGYMAKKPDGSMYGFESKFFTIIDVEDVAVPAGTFTGCIKVRIEGNYDSVAWFCEGFGMVKRLGVEGLMELK